MNAHLIKLARAACLAVVLLPAPPARAAVITYSVTPLGASNYRYDYSISTLAGEPAITEFTIYFDVNVVASLSISATPYGWETIALAPDPALSADGMFDSLALTTGIAAGTTLSGFSATIAHMGGMAPGSQRFDIVDPTNFSVVSSGRTTFAAAVPEPLTIAYAASGLTLLAWRLKRRQHLTDAANTAPA
jgi:hypothetical protein